MLDGLEITQFTYFQQVGGMDLAPIACEITYGLERIAMFLQKVDNVFDLEWGGGVKYPRGPAAGGDRAVEMRLRTGGGARRARVWRPPSHLFDKNLRWGEKLLGFEPVLPRSSTA